MLAVCVCYAGHVLVIFLAVRACMHRVKQHEIDESKNERLETSVRIFGFWNEVLQDLCICK